LLLHMDTLRRFCAGVRLGGLMRQRRATSPPWTSNGQPGRKGHLAQRPLARAYAQDTGNYWSHSWLSQAVIASVTASLTLRRCRTAARRSFIARSGGRITWTRSPGSLRRLAPTTKSSAVEAETDVRPRGLGSLRFSPPDMRNHFQG
jgi:hypothetical protein